MPRCQLIVLHNYLLEHGDLILVQLPDVLPGEVADPEEHLRPKDRTNKPDAVSVIHTYRLSQIKTGYIHFSNC